MGLLSKVCQKTQILAQTLLRIQILDHGYNPAAEAFKNFDQDQPSSMLGSLHLDTDDEPRRGAASRANSVRFDESALHGHLPIRTGSAFGSHPMTERSLSHKSDGRQSSTHSARASSFGFETRPLSATVAPFVPLGPPPGLFILGPVPSIIRCWLDTNFSNESLLYASVCTGSYKSVLDVTLINRLGYQDQITIDREGLKTIKLPVYLPEATIQQSSSRSSSPAPSLPTLTTSFMVQDLKRKTEAIQIFLGCDLLRTRNAEVHFSYDRLTLYDDDRNKLSVPLVRPENAVLFQNLQTTVSSDTSSESPLASFSGPASETFNPDGKAKDAHVDQSFGKTDDVSEETKTQSSTDAMPPTVAPSPSVIGEGRRTTTGRDNSEPASSLSVNTDLKDSESLTNGTTPETPTKSESNTVWGSWRRDSTQGTRADPLAIGSSSISGYQRPGRGRSMKVLRPARLNTSRATSAQQQPVGFDAAPSRFGDSGKPENNENQSPASDQRSFSGDARGSLSSLTNKPRSSNPIGGASAFGWLNASQQKQGPSE